ncbi:MAG TPA: hypothetical protein VMF07_04400 [Solirubrobacteraceae bacterium]|nr:hypothetical protein [Solirubrobacteraceae bacterium]
MTTRLTPLFALIAAALAGLAVLMPAAASAQTVQLGQTTTPLSAPACPKQSSLANCHIVLTRTTALQMMSDAVINPMRVNQQGWIVSFTVGLSRLVAKPSERAGIIKGLNSRYGGAPELAVSVLQPEPGNTYKLVAQSGVYDLTPFLGQLLQQPMSVPPRFSSFTALPVLRGDVVALTVPTWAPVLALDLPGSQFSYRQSRRANCNNPASAQTAQTHIGASATFGCYYAGTRLEYGATEVLDTKVPKTYVGQSVRR